MNEQRTKVFLDRYALRGKDGIETLEVLPADMWDRVSIAIANDSHEQEAFREILEDFKFVPGGRILSGAGTGTEVTFYNCYVIPVETKARRYNAGHIYGPDDIAVPDPGCDSREAILDTMSVMVDIMSRGGGVGINWSVLRPKGAHLKRVNGTTSGPVSWMQVASEAVGVVEQGGTRRGAAMFMLDDWHPDLMEFLNAKRTSGVITNANVSIAVSDDFMGAVKADAGWTFRFPDTGDPRYNSGWTGDLTGWEASGGRVVDYATMPAREVWRAIATAAHASGEPGVVFLGRYNAQSTGLGVERIISVNPCGEQGLGPYSVCNLGSMNLDAYIIKHGSVPTGYKYDFDWDSFVADTETAVTFLDNVIDKNYYFLPENEQAQKNLRRIGLGVMGLADALIALGLRYGSEGAVEFTQRVFLTMKTAAVRRSCVLAQQKGAAPAWTQDMAKRPYLRDYMGTPLGVQIKKYGLRNLFLLTQAPTGSTSILAGVNSGIEPYFALRYFRKDRTGEHEVTAPALHKYGMRYEGMLYSDLPSYFVTADKVTVEEHIAMQAAAQMSIDSSVSKTINGPNSHTVEDVEKAYTMAYDSGLKGLAYYRDGSRETQVLYREDTEKDSTALVEAQQLIEELREQLYEAQQLIPYATDYRRPASLSGETVKVDTRAGTAYITINYDGDNAVEVFFNVGKAGSEVASMAEALGRLASLSLRHGATLGGVANQLEGVGGASQFNKAIPHAIGEALSKSKGRKVVEKPYVRVEYPVESVPSPTVAVDYDFCPDCMELTLVREEGCSKCFNCGFSQC